MFTTDPTIVDLKIKERNLYKAIFSMNFHQVAIPEHGVEEARCYIFIFSEGDKFSAYIVLYIPRTGRRLYYTYSSNPFPQANLPMVEDIAHAFGEDMGFFLDEKSFASSPIAEKNLWIDEQPLFGIRTPEERANPVGTTETAAEPAARQTPAPAVTVDESASTVAAAAAPPTVQPMPTAPVYEQAPAQPIPPTPPAAPVYYQPAPAAPVAQHAPAPPVYSKEVEIEPQVEVEVEEKVNIPAPRQKSTAAPRSSAEKVKTAGPSPLTAQAVQSYTLEGEHRAARKDLPPEPKQQVKKQTRGAIGVVGSEMEALARLVASF